MSMWRCVKPKALRTPRPSSAHASGAGDAQRRPARHAAPAVPRKRIARSAGIAWLGSGSTLPTNARWDVSPSFPQANGRRRTMLPKRGRRGQVHHLAHKAATPNAPRARVPRKTAKPRTANGRGQMISTARPIPRPIPCGTTPTGCSMSARRRKVRRERRHAHKAPPPAAEARRPEPSRFLRAMRARASREWRAACPGSVYKLFRNARPRR